SSRQAERACHRHRPPLPESSSTGSGGSRPKEKHCVERATLGAMWWSQARRRRPAEPQPERGTVSVQQARAAAAAPEAKIDNPKDGPMSIPAPDATALASFYCRVFDWKARRDRDLLDAGGEFVARLRPDLAVTVERDHLGTVLVEDVDE